jgi:hypothetical protein
MCYPAADTVPTQSLSQRPFNLQNSSYGLRELFLCCCSFHYGHSDREALTRRAVAEGILGGLTTCQSVVLRTRMRQLSQLRAAVSYHISLQTCISYSASRQYHAQIVVVKRKDAARHHSYQTIPALYSRQSLQLIRPRTSAK